MREKQYRIGIGESFRCESEVEPETHALQYFVVNDMPDRITQFR